MNIENYDFESKLEQGFKTLFNTAGIDLHIADDLDDKLPDENVRLDLSVGSVISNEHLKDSTIYDNYGGALEIEIQTPRVADDQVASDEMVVSGAGTIAVNATYLRDGDYNLKPKYARIGGSSYEVIRWNANRWEILDNPGSGANDVYTSNDDVATPDLVTTWSVQFPGTAPAPTVTSSPASQFTSRHTELVATARKAIEEIDAAVLATNWPGALSPTKIKPTGTERDNDAEHRVTKLSYDLQFRIT